MQRGPTAACVSGTLATWLINGSPGFTISCGPRNCASHDWFRPLVLDAGSLADAAPTPCPVPRVRRSWGFWVVAPAFHAAPHRSCLCPTRHCVATASARREALELVETQRAKFPRADASEMLMGRYDFGVQVQDYSVFADRTRDQFAPDTSLTIEENLVHFIRWVEAQRHFVVFNNAAIMQLFSRNSIERVVFLIRHPVNAYVSLADPNRHPELFEALGGVNAERSLHLRADNWNRRVEEYLRCRDQGLDPVLIRYEHAAEDAHRRPELAPLFANMVARSREPADPDIEDAMRRLTEHNYHQLYAEWR